MKDTDRNKAIAKNLANAGFAFDKEIQQRTREVIKDIPKANEFFIAIAQSLTWTGHAVNKNDYFKESVNFLCSNDETIPSDLSFCAGRYGVEQLRTVLFNWRKLYHRISLPADFLRISLENLTLFQSTSLKIACNLHRKGEIMNIGAWLFCAPFKIILCLREDLWKKENVNEILMPLGLEVVRGVKKMIRERYSYAKFISQGDLTEEEGDITEGLGTIHIVQAMCKNISKDVNSNVLNINSGLWKLGAGEL